MKGYISKDKVRLFISRIKEEKINAIREEGVGRLTEALNSCPELGEIGTSLTLARMAATSLQNKGFGDRFMLKIPTKEELIEDTIDRCKYMYGDVTATWAKIYAVAKPYEGQIDEIESAARAAYQIVYKAPNGRMAADKLKELGLDFYAWVVAADKRTMDVAPDLSALKGGD